MEIKQISDFCTENKLLEEGDRVLLGLSGGADSVCLLFVLLELQERFKLDICAVHVNHGIRGDEADRDEQFCRELCAGRKVRFMAEHIDVPQLSAVSGDTPEEAGRKARYEIFERIAEELDCGKIAVAHHKNDQAETVLFQLIRGSRVTGMAGIRPRNGRIIRPLLCVDRTEIEEYLLENKINFVTDSTNLCNDASRNVVRHEVLPALSGLQTSAVQHICDTADYMRRVDEYLEREAKKLYGRAAVEEEGRITISLSELQRGDEIIIERVLYEALCRISRHKKDITHRHVEMAASLCSMQTGARADFKYGITGQKVFETLVFTEKNKFDNDTPNCNNTTYETSDFSVVEAWRMQGETTADFAGRLGGFGSGDRRKLLDAEALKLAHPGADKASIMVRDAAGSDYITVYADGRKKRVFDLLMEKKVPESDRSRTPVAAYEDEVFLIKDVRGCEAYRINDGTEHVFVIEFR